MGIPEYRYSGARSLVMLHEKTMREFIETWKKAKAKNINLPDTDDPTYDSCESLLFHVLNWSRRYMVWICEKLDLPDPGIAEITDMDQIEKELPVHLEDLLDKWKTPLEDIEMERFHRPDFTTPWKAQLCIESMMEHAVMHPIRHKFQIDNIMEGK
ncbi:hypothetical protein ACFL7D_01520 [candidate division KSB1 bacterium]